MSTLLMFVLNALLGGVVWSAIDSDGALFRWYESCPARIAWFAQPLVLTAWPVGLVLYWRKAWLKNKGDK